MRRKSAARREKTAAQIFPAQSTLVVALPSMPACAGAVPGAGRQQGRRCKTFRPPRQELAAKPKWVVDRFTEQIGQESGPMPRTLHSCSHSSLAQEAGVWSDGSGFGAAASAVSLPSGGAFGAGAVRPRRVRGLLPGASCAAAGKAQNPRANVPNIATVWKIDRLVSRIMGCPINNVNWEAVSKPGFRQPCGLRRGFETAS